MSKARHVRRDFLARLIWPDAPARKARHSLSQALYSIRKQFPGIELITSPTHVHLEIGQFDLDVARFDRLFELKLWEDAVDTYTGHFLADLNLEKSRGFTEWQESHRHVFKTKLERILDTLIKEPPKSTDTNLSLVLQKCRELELRVPGAAAIAEAQQIIVDGDSRTAGFARSVDRLPFVGRQKELGRLLDTWQCVTRGNRCIVVIVGTRGVGKSRLFNQFLRVTAIRGARTFVGRCAIAEAESSFAPLAEALQDGLTDSQWEDLPQRIRSTLRVLVPERGEPAPWIANHAGDLGERTMFEAINDTLRFDGRETVLALDDVHWADSSTRAFLQYFARSSPNDKMLLLLTVSKEDLILSPRILAPMMDFGGYGRVETIEIGPFTEADVAEFVAALRAREQIPSEIEFDIGTLARNSGGRPLFLLDALGVKNSSLADQGQRESARSIQDVESRARAVVQRQLAGLDPEQRATLAAVTICGRAAYHGAVRYVAGLRLPSFHKAVSTLIELELVIESGRRLSVACNLFRDVLHDTFGIEQLRQLHARATRYLCRHHKKHFATIALHADMAALRECAYDHALLAAAERRHSGLLSDAVRWYKIAVRNASDPIALRGALSDCTDLQIALRRYNDARVTIESINAEVLDEVLTVRRHYVAMAADFEVGKATAESVCRKARDLAATHRGTDAAAELAAQVIVSSAHQIGDGRFLTKVFPELVRQADTGDASKRANILSLVANAMAAYGSTSAALEIADRALDLATGDGRPDSVVSALLARGVTQLMRGNITCAKEDISAAARLSEQYHLKRLIGRVAANSAVIDIEEDRLSDAEQTLAVAYDQCEQQDQLVIDANRLVIWYHDPGRSAILVSALRRLRQNNATLKSRWANVVATTFEGLAALKRRRIHDASQCLVELMAEPSLFECGLTDVSYTESFIAEMNRVRGNIAGGCERLNDAIQRLNEGEQCILGRLRLQMARAQLKRAESRAEARTDLKRTLDEATALKALLIQRECQQRLSRL